MMLARSAILGIGHNDARRLVATGALGLGLAYARSGTATRLDTSGALVSVAANAVRFNGPAQRLLVEEARSNTVRNPRAEGAAAGTPGTLPTNWTTVNATGITRSVVGTGSENGIPYCDIRFAGTPTSATSCLITFEGATQVPALVGQDWAHAAFVRLVAGSATNISAFQLRVIELDSASATLANGAVTIVPSSAQLHTQRFAQGRTLNTAGCAFVRAGIAANITSGLAFDFTLRIGAPQLEAGAFASSTILPSAGTPAVAARGSDQVSWSPAGGFGSAGTLVVRAVLPQPATAAAWQGLWQLDDGTDANRILLRNNAGGLTVSGLLDAGGANLATLAAGNVTSGTAFRAAFAWNSAGQALCLTGGTLQTAAVAVPAGLTRLLLGQGAAALNRALNGEIELVDWRPRRVPDALLQSLANQP